MNYKPSGYSSVSPYLIVEKAEKTIDFLLKVFDGEMLRVFHRENGSIMHAEVRVDDTVIMIGQMSTGQRAQVHIYVKELDVVFDKALQQDNCSVVQPIEEKGDGDRRGGVRDENGTTWWISTQLP